MKTVNLKPINENVVTKLADPSDKFAGGHALIGWAARKARKDHRKDDTYYYGGIEQGEMATKMHLSQSALSNLESGQRKMNLIELFRMADILEKHPLKLLSEMIEAMEEGRGYAWR